ncbi:MAG: PQQ-binding-like beta-propeller repeat protein [Gaiellaceae bacterium]
MRKPLVYVMSGERLQAHELSSGQVRWTARGRAGPEPAADGDFLIDTSPGGVIRRYVPRSGHIIWQRSYRPSNALFQRPVLAGGTWYVLPIDEVDAVDARSGHLRWFRDWQCSFCGVAVAAGRVYVVGAADGDQSQKGVYALDANSGTTVWSAATKGDPSQGASPIVSGGIVYVRTMGGRYLARTFEIEAFRASNGKRLWQAPVGRARGFWSTPPAADETTVVYPSEDGNLYALDARTGSLRWKDAKVNNNISPAIANGIVWGGDTDGHLVAFDEADGAALWRSTEIAVDPNATNVGGNNGASPAIAGRYVLTTTTDGKLLAYRTP